MSITEEQNLPENTEEPMASHVDLSAALNICLSAASDISREKKDRIRARNAAKNLQMIVSDYHKSFIASLDI